MTRATAKPRSTRRSFGRLRKFRSGRWKASYTGPDGRLYHAPHTFGAKIDAEGWLHERRKEIDRELWSPPATEEQAQAAAITKKAAAITFGEYAENWVSNRTVKGRPLRPRTREHYDHLLKAHIYPTFRNKPVRDITMESVDRWYTKVAADAPTMRAHSYGLLRTIMETARTRDRLIVANPCAIRGAGSTERKVKPKPASINELAIIVEAMPERLQAMVLLATWCAMRDGELVELRRGDIDIYDLAGRDEAGNKTKERRGVIRIRRAASGSRVSGSSGHPKVRPVSATSTSRLT